MNMAFRQPGRPKRPGEAVWSRSVAGVLLGGLASVSLATNVTWLPLPLDVALLLALLLAVPIWVALIFYSFWAQSWARAWMAIATITLPSLLFNLAMFYAS